MENFQQFCINVTNPDLPDISTDESYCDDKLVEFVNIVTNEIKNKLGFIDRVSIPNIEGKFDKLDNVGKILEITGHEDIPDEFINYISEKVFDEKFNMLSNDKRSIIAVLSVYILIYHFKGGYCYEQ